MSFDITSVLGDIAKNRKPDRKQIEYVELHLIDANPMNLYSMNGIDELAENIRAVGLMEPLIVKEHSGRYMLISGHRRRAALRKLAATDGLEHGFHEEIPVLIEDAEAALPGIEAGSEAEKQARTLAEELKLLFANSDTRVLSSADKAMQVRRIREIFTGLSDLGYSFPGKMRDHVAAAANISATRVARLDVIDKGLAEPVLRKAWEDGRLSETTAYEVARYALEVQVMLSASDADYIIRETTANAVAMMEGAKAAYEESRIGFNSESGLKAASTAEADEIRDQESETDPEQEQTGNRGRDGSQERGANTSFKPAENANMNEYLEKTRKEDDILRELCYDFLPSIMRSLMHFKPEHDFSKNFRQANIDQLRKHEAHSRYATGWNSNNGKGWIDWDSRGIRVVSSGRGFRRSWTDFYDALTGAALQRARQSTNPPAVSAADTEPQWSTGKPKKQGDYTVRIGVPAEEDNTAAAYRTIRWNGEAWVTIRNGAPVKDTVYRWMRLPEV